MEELIAGGHPPAAVFSYSPRQAAGFLMLLRRRKKQEAALQLNIMTAAARGDETSVKGLYRELSKD